jgi:hypothetical protein
VRDGLLGRLEEGVCVCGGKRKTWEEKRAIQTTVARLKAERWREVREGDRGEAR